MKLVLQETGGWIKNADTKVTVVAAAFGVSSTFSVPRIVTATTNLAEIGCVCEWLVWGGLLIAALAAALVAAGSIYSALIPRTQNAVNRFSWPSLASDFARTPEPLDGERLMEEAWTQAITLAGIAKSKFRHLKRALKAFGLYLVVLLLLTILAAIFGLS